MSYPSYSTNNGVGITDATGDIQIGVGINGVELTQGLLTTPVTNQINPTGFTQGANALTFSRLYTLGYALNGLTEPLNATTTNFNDALQVQDYNNTLAPPASHSEVRLGSNPLGLFGLDYQQVGTTNYFALSGNSDIHITPSGSLGIIDLEASNLNSFGYAMPICFSRQRTDTITYASGSQIFDMVYQTDCQIPQQFISNSPSPSYTSSIWKIDFALNCYLFSNNGDKGLGLYIEFNDNASNIYTPITYNVNTPFSYYKTFGYNSGANAPYVTFNWTDYVDLAGLYNTSTANFPLEVKLYFAGDSALTTNFHMLITLTKTNLI